MAYEVRLNAEYLFGTLTSALTISGTTATSTSLFPGLGSYTTQFYLPLVLHDPAAGLHEVIWVTAHSASSSSVTIERGKEGTTARAWPSGTQVLCAPTVRDGLASYSRATLPSDGHVGLRASVNDEGPIAEKTYTAGYQPSVGVANPADFGVRIDTTAIPATSVVIARGGRFTGSTSASGKITATYTAAFPNQTLRVIPIWVNGSSASYVLAVDPSTAATASAFTVFLYAPGTGVTAGAGVSATFDYIALGY